MQVFVRIIPIPVVRLKISILLDERPGLLSAVKGAS